MTLSPRAQLQRAVAASPVVAAPMPASFPADKSSWRAHCRTVTRAASPVLRRSIAVRVAGEVLSFASAAGIARVALYAELGAEVSTRELANLLLANGCSVAYPRLRRDGVTIDICASDGPASLQQRPRSRLMEPVGAVIDPAELALIVVPVMALDAQLRRLGRGGGSYDRYLPQLPEGCARVGLCFADCVLPWGPVASHDAQLAAVCTEHGLFGPAQP